MKIKLFLPPKPNIEDKVSSVNGIISKIKINKKVQSLIAISLRFCTFKSDHFEFLKRFPRLVTVDLSLLLRSKKSFSKPVTL